MLDALDEPAFEDLLLRLLMADDESVVALDDDVALEEKLSLEDAENVTAEEEDKLEDEETLEDEDELAIEEDELVLDDVLDAMDEEELDDGQVGGVVVSEKTLMELISQKLCHVSESIAVV